MELTIPMSRTFASPAAVIPLDRRRPDAPPAAIRLVLAHDAGLARAGLSALLDREADIAVVGEASRSEDAVALTVELRPDLVVLDARLPGLDTHEATRQIAAASDGAAAARVLMIGGAGTDRELFGALHAGASGFLVRDAGAAELLRAIRCVAQGDALLSPSVTRRVIDEFASLPDACRPVPERLEELTAREREVMGLAAMGLTNDQIAERLVVSRATAKTHVSRAMMKLHAHDRAQLVALAYQSRLVEPRRAGAEPGLISA